MKLLAADLARVIDDAALFAGRDSAIPIINAVQLESTPKHLIAVATDRFTMGASMAEYHDADGPDFTAVLKLSQAQILSKVAKSTRAAFTDVTIKVEDGKAWFAFTSGETLCLPLLDVTYPFPDWRKIVQSRDEDGSTQAFAANPHYLAKFARVNGARRMVAKFGGPNKPALITIGSQFVGLIMPVRLGDEDTAPPDWLARPEPKKPARARKSTKKAVA